MNNDCVEVDELLFQLADYKNDYADMAAEKLLRKCSASWEACQYLQDACSMAGYPIVPVTSCDELSKGYRCKYVSLGNTALLMSGFERHFL